MPAAQILCHFVALCVSGPNGALLWRNAVLTGRNLCHIIPKLISTHPLLQTTRIITVVQTVLSGRSRTGTGTAQTSSGTAQSGSSQGSVR